jgi:hypothetical protein
VIKLYENLCDVTSTSNSLGFSYMTEPENVMCDMGMPMIHGSIWPSVIDSGDRTMNGGVRSEENRRQRRYRDVLDR